MYFRIALSVTLLALFYMVPGYLTAKLGKTKAEHLPTLSGILIYIGTPFMVISSFLTLPFDKGMLLRMGLFFLVTLLLQAVFFLAVFFLSGATRHSARRIIAMGATCGNVGFFGIPIVRTLFPDSPEVACYAVCFTVSMNVLIFTLGVFCLTGDKKYVSLRSALLNPTMLGLVIGLPLYLSGMGAQLPAVLADGIHTLGDLTTPLCMFILGIRLAFTPLGSVFRKKVFLVCLLKLVAFPLLCFVIALPFSSDAAFRGSLLILSATPCAAVILSLAEIHHSEEETSAGCILASVLLCLFTIPAMSLLI